MSKEHQSDKNKKPCPTKDYKKKTYSEKNSSEKNSSEKTSSEKTSSEKTSSEKTSSEKKSLKGNYSKGVKGRRNKNDSRSESDEYVEQFVAPRGDAFKELITSVLLRGDLEQKYVVALTDKESMDLYNEVFTAPSANDVNNYEMHEMLGDVIANCIFKWYTVRRFPQLRCPEGVEFVAKLLIKYGSKDSFFSIAEKLGFWPYISASVEDRRRNMKPLLEDVFEAWCGATVDLLDRKFLPGTGYGIVYRVLESIFSEIDISLSFEALVDAKTRYKETFDKNKELGEVEYLSVREEIDSGSGSQMYITVTSAYQLPTQHSHKKQAYQKTIADISRKRRQKQDVSPNAEEDALTYYKKFLVKLGEGTAALQIDAEQKAAAKAIETLRKKGVYREPHPLYAKFNI
jgi:dsRNA-specific ribonuclease